VLGRSLDELPPQTRRLLLLSTRWSRRSASGRRSSAPTTASRGATCGSDRLGRYAVENPSAPAGGTGIPVGCIAAGAARASFTSSTSRWGDGRPVLAGLIDVEKLGGEVRRPLRGGKRSRGWRVRAVGAKSGPKRGVSGGGRGEESPAIHAGEGWFFRKSAKKHYKESRNEIRKLPS
jgi:hypothetical protein